MSRTVTYRLRNLDCAECAVRIERGLQAAPFVKAVSVDFATLTMKIDTDDMPSVNARIRDLEPEVEVEEVKAAAPRGDGGEPSFSLRRELILLGSSGILFALGTIFESSLHGILGGLSEYIVFGAAYLLAGWNVLFSAFRSIAKGRVFNENLLMTIATGGAFALHEVSEAVGVMIFYKIGEILQGLSVHRSRRSIRRLLDLRPDVARLKRDGGFVEVRPEEVAVGAEISVRPGERVPLDGTVLQGDGFVDTSALTGESVPRRVEVGDEVLAGFISTDGSLAVRVTKPAGESSASKIIALVENATHAKARTEQFITRFARTYTPVVVAVAALIAFVPPLILGAGHLQSWAMRALTILVISCPCALVVSIPLGYFGGVGGAARRGILVKGAMYLDALASVKTVVFDKTGTLTKGVFRVQSVHPRNGLSEAAVLKYAALAERNSNHPVGASIRDAYDAARGGGEAEGAETAGSGAHGALADGEVVGDLREVGGHGVLARVGARTVVVGNDALLHREGIAHDRCSVGGTVAHVAVDNSYAGYILIGDEPKAEAAQAVRELGALGVSRTVLLTGDSAEIARRTAESLGIAEQYGDLLPEDKVSKLERIMAEQGRGGRTAFVGDGINDAPVLARADVGIAMGKSGSDVAVETADVVLMSDSPAKVPEAIRRARATRAIVIQNIAFALGAKAVFLLLGALGVATMWEAVIADMGVALVAILNASRAMR